MSYFIEIPNYKTYSGKEADFHFSYNANSGGGQSFLGGKFINVEGELTWPTVLDDYMGVFLIESHNDNGQDLSYLLNDNKGEYKIKPRGDGSNSMKLEIGNQRTAPSKLISSFFMLPSTCSVNSSSNLDVSILTSNNFWLHSMWLECAHQDTANKEVHLKPIDFIFSGGKNKGSKGTERYFKLDFVKRVEDILNLVNNIESLPIEIGKNLEVFASIYKNESVFDYKKCEEATKKLMVFLAQKYPNEYSGIEDPLPFLIKIFNSTVNTSKGKGDGNKVIQTIYFGAPGTGKSYGIKQDYEINKDNSFRTTFHPDTDYSSFVGCYKPIKEGSNISYDFVPQVFTEAYIAAWRRYKENEQVYLIIEEINRGNCAQIFGDIFQLLDRNEKGFSEYEIKPERDLQKYLKDEFSGQHKDDEDKEIPALNVDEYPKVVSGEELVLPPNLNIIATMNTSDQSLFPIDSAFKRRWAWKYIAIKNMPDKKYCIRFRDQDLSWWVFVNYVNNKIKAITSSEDKKIGYFFVRPDIKKNDTDEEATIISTNLFVSKVLFYLWTDIFKDYLEDENNIFRYEFEKPDVNGEEFEIISFNSLFDHLGKIDINMLGRFLEQIDFGTNDDSDVASFEDDTKEDTIDEKNGAESEQTLNNDKSVNKKNPIYYLNGIEVKHGNNLSTLAMQYYVDNNPQLTVDEVINNWKDIDDAVKVIYFIQTEEEFKKRKDKERDRRTSIITWGRKKEKKIYMSTNGWIFNGEDTSVKRFIKAINDKKEWGITITYDEK